MDNEHKTPFINSTTEMLETMLGIPADESDVAEMLGNEAVAGTVLLEGNPQAGIELRFPLDTANKIVAEMLGMGLDEIDEDTIKDGVGEMANIVAGNVKANLADLEMDFTLTLPMVEKIPISSCPSDQEQVRIKTELGEFDLIFWIKLPTT